MGGGEGVMGGRWLWFMEGLLGEIYEEKFIVDGVVAGAGGLRRVSDSIKPCKVHWKKLSAS